MGLAEGSLHFSAVLAYSLVLLPQVAQLSPQPLILLQFTRLVKGKHFSGHTAATRTASVLACMQSERQEIRCLTVEAASARDCSMCACVVS